MGETKARLVFRSGKTRRDRSSGVLKRSEENKLARAAWNNETTQIRNNSARGRGAFPYYTCNGKRNRVPK